MKRSENCKCLPTAIVWQLQISRNRQCLLGLLLKVSDNCKCLAMANISQQTMSFRPFTESVWQLQMSNNWKYLVTNNVFQPYNVKCLTTASVSKQKVSGNSKCLDNSKSLTTENISQRTMSFSLMLENVWQPPVSLRTMSVLTLSCTWKCLATESVILVQNGLCHATEDGS